MGAIKGSIEERNSNILFIKLIFALLVIYSHSFPISTGHNNGEMMMALTFGQFSFGNISVLVFFILGGFLVTQSYLRNDNAITFLKARILRLFPALIVVIFITIFIIGPIFSSLSFEEYFSSTDTYKYFSNCYLRFVDTLPGVFDNQNLISVNGSLWTLGYEFICYLSIALLGVLGMLKKREIPLGVFFLFLLSYMFRDILFFNNSSFLNINLYKYLELNMCFFFGCVAYLYRDKICFSWTAFVISFCLLVFGFYMKQYSLSICIFGGYCLLFICYSHRVKLPNISKLGDISYGIYILGFLIQQIFVSLFKGEMEPHLNMFLTILVIFPLSYLMNRFIETPCLKLKKIKLFDKLLMTDNNREKFHTINSKIKNRVDSFFTIFNKYAACWILLILVTTTTVFSILSFPGKSVSFDYGSKNDFLFSNGFYPQQKDENFRWINKRGMVKMLFPKNSSYLLISGYSPETFKEVSEVSIYIGSSRVCKEDISKTRGFELNINISSFRSEYYPTLNEIIIEFNDVHKPKNDDADKRYLSGIVWKIEVVTS